MIAERIHSQKNDAKADAKAALLRKQSAELKRKIDNGTKAILDGVDSDELREAVKECSAQKKAIDRRILEIETAADNAGRTVSEIRESAKYFADLSKLSREQQKNIIQKFVWRIYVYDKGGPDGGNDVRIVLAPTEQARAELDNMASDYVAITDLLSNARGNALPLPFKFDNITILVNGIVMLSTSTK